VSKKVLGGRRILSSDLVRHPAEKVLVRDGRVASHDYEEPFAALLGSHKTQIVVLNDRCANRGNETFERRPVALGG
jgi:predicted amidohydrolase YtcJ